jgi:ketosteroid isomerase-like protein
MSIEANKALIVRYLQGVERFDLDDVAQCFAPEAIQHLPAPGKTSLDLPPMQVGRDLIIEGFRKFIPYLYKPETIRMEIQNVIGEGDFVAARWILHATTQHKSQPYANHYHFLFRFEDGLIAEYWEFCDTAYSASLMNA